VSNKIRKHRDYIINQWPEDLSSNFDGLATPYPCLTCKRPCSSIRTLRTHKCQPRRSNG
jgi:hypothetical protein